MKGALTRSAVIAANTYREAVRARLLLSLTGLAVIASIYSVFIGALSLRQEARDVANIGSFAISAFAVTIAIVLGATSLYRELELKTVFPILSRPLERWEYVVGKYLGTVLTLVVFILMEGGFVLWLLALVTRGGRGADGVLEIASGAPTDSAMALPLGVGIAFIAVLVGLVIWRKNGIVFILIPWSAAYFATMAVLASSAGVERRVVLGNSLLSLFEGGIVAAIATFFSSFSSPFLTAAFTFGVFLVGRSADTLANLPARVFGEQLKAFGRGLVRIFPNLQLYVPPRPVLQGTLADVSTAGYIASAAAHSALYATAILAVAVVLFRRRDFQ